MKVLHSRPLTIDKKYYSIIEENKSKNRGCQLQNVSISGSMLHFRSIIIALQLQRGAGDVTSQSRAATHVHVPDGNVDTAISRNRILVLFLLTDHVLTMEVNLEIAEM